MTLNDAVPNGDPHFFSSILIFSESYEENRRNQKQEARPSHQKQVCFFHKHLRYFVMYLESR